MAPCDLHSALFLLLFSRCSSSPLVSTLDLRGSACSWSSLCAFAGLERLTRSVAADSSLWHTLADRPCASHPNTTAAAESEPIHSVCSLTQPAAAYDRTTDQRSAAKAPLPAADQSDRRREVRVLQRGWVAKWRRMIGQGSMRHAAHCRVPDGRKSELGVAEIIAPVSTMRMFKLLVYLAPHASAALLFLPLCPFAFIMLLAFANTSSCANVTDSDSVACR